MCSREQKGGYDGEKIGGVIILYGLQANHSSMYFVIFIKVKFFHCHFYVTFEMKSMSIYNG